MSRGVDSFGRANNHFADPFFLEKKPEDKTRRWVPVVSFLNEACDPTDNSGCLIRRHGERPTIEFLRC